MNPEAVNQLKEKLGPNVSFEREDLMVYNFDIGVMPKIIMSTINHTPETVVIADSVEQVADTLRIAAQHGIPVTPRGQGSSGYGGAIPTKGGILLDMTKMNRILAVNRVNRTVDVEPGAIWNELSRQLQKQGLDNKVYPTSGASSTVGGWFAQGGVGIGSLKYGSIRDVVEEIDVVALDGSVKTYTDKELDSFNETCGIMGVITRVRLSCREAEEIVPFAVAFSNVESLHRFVIEARKELAPYTIILHSPDYVQMQKEGGMDEPIPDNMFLAIVGIEKYHASAEKLGELARGKGGMVLDDHIAHAEWEGRFHPMRIKKIGPDMVVSEFYLPDASLSKVWNKIESDLAGDLLGMEAVVVHNGRIAVLVYIPDDSQELLYHIRVSKSIRMIRIAKKYGGALYSSGLWFASSADKILGREKYDRVLREKKEIDPAWLMNPGKIVPIGVKWMPGIDVCTFMNAGSNVVLPLGKVFNYNRPAFTRKDK